MLLIIPILFILLLSFLLLIIHMLDKDIGAGKVLVYGWSFLFLLYIIGLVVNMLTSRIILDKEDYYGEYIVCRDYFPGEQADWQYNHFRFEIKENDSIYFYVTEKEKIIKAYKGRVYFTNHKSKRIDIQMSTSNHHVLFEDPTIHRSAWSFYLTFDSPKFNTMFFRKGKWKKI